VLSTYNYTHYSFELPLNELIKSLRKLKKKKYGFYYHKGETLKIVFNDVKSIKGKLLFKPPYKVITETEDGREIRIFKHAIRPYIID